MDSGEDQDKIPEFGPIKRPSAPDMDNGLNIQQPQKPNSNKKTLILLVILFLVLIGGGFFILKSRSSLRKLISAPTPTPVPISTPMPTEAPKKTLTKSEWSLEILNGSGVTGAAKSLADKIQALGYPVTKVGNADKETYSQTQILVKKSLQDQVELIIADLKDIIKIASVAGELKDSTASARIIIGKDVVK